MRSSPQQVAQVQSWETVVRGNRRDPRSVHAVHAVRIRRRCECGQAQHEHGRRGGQRQKPADQTLKRKPVVRMHHVLRELDDHEVDGSRNLVRQALFHVLWGRCGGWPRECPTCSRPTHVHTHAPGPVAGTPALVCRTRPWPLVELSQFASSAWYENGDFLLRACPAVDEPPRATVRTSQPLRSLRPKCLRLEIALRLSSTLPKRNSLDALT